MVKIWDIKLFEQKNEKYCVKISYYGGEEIKGIGSTPVEAYDNATRKMVIKPWLENEY